MIQQNQHLNRKKKQRLFHNLQKKHLTKIKDSEEKAEGGVAIKSQMKNDLFLPVKEIDHYLEGYRETTPNLSNGVIRSDLSYIFILKCVE